MKGIIEDATTQMALFEALRINTRGETLAHQSCE